MVRSVVIFLSMGLSAPLFGAHLSGHVLDAATQKGIPAVDVTATDPNGKTLTTSLSDGSGAYALEELPEGRRILVTWSKSGYQAHPTRRLITPSNTPNYDPLMLADQAENSYYKVVAARLRDAGSTKDATEIRELLPLLPKAKQEAVAVNYRTLTGHSLNDGGGSGDESKHFALLKEPRISESEARATALKKSPGQIMSGELEREHGKLLYTFDIKTTTGALDEVSIDALTGSVFAVSHESRAKEAAEKKQEAKEKPQAKKH